MKIFELNNKQTIPAVGFGVFMIPNDGPTYDATLAALKAGYRHIDTAAGYCNESDVGKAIKDSGIDRSEIFITSKLWLQDYGYENAKKGIANSLKALDTDYIDLYLELSQFITLSYDIDPIKNLTPSSLCHAQNSLEENAKINYTIVDFGGKHSITNYYSNLQGDNCDNQLNTIYLGKENQVFDLNYIGELRGKKSNIDIEVQGALKDTSKKHFKGTIDFKKGCKKATGNENEACMLLSDTAKSIALPMLLCSEEEVEGNHSSSAGKIGEKELFYIMSRGFELKEAMKLMVRARFNQILEKIENEELREEILQEIDKRLD